MLRLTGHCIIALALLLGLTYTAAGLQAQSATTTYPGTAVLAPFGAVTFAQQQPTSGPPLPAAPGHLFVQSGSLDTTTVSYDGETVTVSAPSGQRVFFTSGCTATPANPASCTAVPCGQECLEGPPAYDPGRGYVSFTTASTVAYPAGWNLVAGPEGSYLTGATGSLYTLQPGDTSYEQLPADSALHACWGYWAYFPTGGSLAFSSNPYTACWVYPAQGEDVLVGNPSATFEAMVLNGDPASGLVVYSPTAGYQQVAPPLHVGQGAWVVNATATAVNGILIQPLPLVHPSVPPCMIFLPSCPTPTPSPTRAP